MHRYYKIENGNHVDSYFDRYRQEPAYVRPILPCYWAAFKELEEWVERKGDNPQPPSNRTVPHPAQEGTHHRCQRLLRRSGFAEHHATASRTAAPTPIEQPRH